MKNYLLYLFAFLLTNQGFHKIFFLATNTCFRSSLTESNSCVKNYSFALYWSIGETNWWLPGGFQRLAVLGNIVCIFAVLWLIFGWFLCGMAILKSPFSHEKNIIKKAEKKAMRFCIFTLKLVRFLFLGSLWTKSSYRYTRVVWLVHF